VLLSTCGLGWLTRWFAASRSQLEHRQVRHPVALRGDGSYLWLLATPEGADVGHTSVTDLVDRMPTDFTLSISVGPAGDWSRSAGWNCAGRWWSWTGWCSIPC
jgi:hypothetical protein